MEKTFEFDLEMSKDLEKKYNVYIHFDFDDFDADAMIDMREAKAKGCHGLFRIRRMVPQGYFHYFFSY